MSYMSSTILDEKQLVKRRMTWWQLTGMLAVNGEGALAVPRAFVVLGLVSMGGRCKGDPEHRSYFASQLPAILVMSVHIAV